MEEFAKLNQASCNDDEDASDIAIIAFWILSE